MRRTALALGLLMALVPAVGQAQQRAGTTGGTLGGTSATSGSSGMFGSRNLGSSLSAGNRGFAGGGGAAGAGVQSMGGGTGRTQQNDATIGAQVQGNERFTRGGRQAGQFVGADTGDLPSFLTDLATGGTGQQRGRGQTQNQRGRQNANQQQGGARGGATGRAAQQQAQYRVSRTVGFEYALPTAAEVRTQLGTRIQTLPGVRAVGPIDVALSDRTVVLRGSVATAHDRDLAERLALLEAGVDRVQNELTVAPPPASAVPTPAAPAN